jgi:hypothetical protein
VTIPADLGHPAVQELIVVAAVGNVTIQAILIDWRMGPHPRPSFIRMALVAKFGDRIALQLGRAKPSMMFMAVRAFDLSFPDGMVGGPIFLGPDALMTEIAEVRLGGF